MALRIHLRSVHGQIAKAEMRFSMEIDSLEGVPTCSHCGFQFRYWLGLKQHINNDTCPAREVRAQKLQTHSQAEYDPTTSPVAHNQVLLDLLRQHGAVSLLDQIGYDHIWAKLTHQCSICTQWSTSTRALAFHFQATHGKRLFSHCQAWVRRRLKSKVLVVTNPCKWCGKSFSEKSILQCHCCFIAVQIRALERVALGKGLDVDDDDDDDDAVEFTVPSDGGRCGKASAGGLPKFASIHVRCDKEAMGGGEGARPVCRRRLTRKTKEAQECEPQERQSQESGHGPSHCPDESLDSQTRGCAEQDEARCGVRPAHRNFSTDLGLFVEGVSQMERGQGGRQVDGRLTPTDLAGDAVLPGAFELHQEDEHLPHRECGIQEAGDRQCDLSGQVLLQKSVGPKGQEAHQLQSEHVHDGAPAQAGGIRSVATGSFLGASLSRDEATCRALHRQVDLFLAGAVSACGSLDGIVPLACGDGGDDNLGRDAEQTSQINTSAFAIGDRAAEAAPWVTSLASSTSSSSRLTTSALPSSLASMRRASTSSVLAARQPSSMSAFRTWMQHGRDCLPIPRFPNEGNQCYRNAAITALVVCYHFTSERFAQWGCIHDIVEMAMTRWQGLTSVESFRSALENWNEPWLQHDVCEYLLHLSLSIPILHRPLTEARFMMEQDVVREECLCALDPDRSGMSIQECIDRWHDSTGLIKAFTEAPPLVFLPIVRFVYDERRLRRQPAIVLPEPSEIELPVFDHDLGIEVQRIGYRCVACILHRGASPNSGHYRTLVYCEGGFVIADDEKFGDFWANLSEDDLSQIYVLCLVRVPGLQPLQPVIVL